MSLERKIDILTDNVIALAGQTEKRAKNAELLNVQAQNKLNSALGNLDRTTDNIRQTAAKALHEGMDKSVESVKERIHETAGWLENSAREVMSRQEKSAKELKKLVWSAVAAFVVLGILCVGIAVYLIYVGKKEISRSDWVSEINQAVSNGKLVRCSSEGGVCAKVKGRLVRLDN
ncbi:hypothetical protein [Neisseria sp.]|uniref:hypothetical protein n=1 Tax=Neisseria sp. TaxID=192066 RepID=UPI00359FBD1C